MKLVQFPAPDARAPDAYGLLNPRPFQWVQPFVSATLRYAFYRVWKELGPAVQPPQIADCSMEDGSTPREDDGELRHPGGAHDGGINVDCTYYMADVTTDSWSVGPDDGAELTGPPSRMDLPRQARWYEVIGELDLEYSGSLIRLAAVDPLAEAPIDEAIDADLAESGQDRNQAKAITFSSRSGGWGPTHNTHSHLRFIARDDGDRIASEIEAKIEALLSQGPGPAPPPLPEPSTETGGGDGNKAGPVPAQPKAPGPRIPEGARKLDPGRGWGQLEENAAFWVPGTKANPTPMPPLFLRVPGVTIIAEEPGGFYIDDGQPIRGEDAPCGLRGMNADRLRWDGGDLRDSPGRNVRLTDCADVQIENADSSGAGIEAWQFGNCPRMRMTNCKGRDAGRPHSSTSPDRQHALYGSGDMDGSEFDGFWGSGCPGSVQFNGGGFSDHVIRGLVARNFSLRNMGSGGTPAVSLMAVQDSTFENWLIEASRAGAVLFDDGRGEEYGVRGNRFVNWSFSDLEVWTIHLQVGGGNTWIGLRGAAVPDGDIDGGPGREAPPSPAPGPAGNPQVHPHAGDWPTDPHPGMVVEMTPGAYGALEFKGYAGVTVRAVGPVTAKALVVGPGCEGLRFELWEREHE